MKHNILQFHGFAGPFAERIPAGVLRSEAEISDRIAGLEEAGSDEILQIPSSTAIEQVDQLASAVLGR